MTKSSIKLHRWIWLLAVPLMLLGSGIVFAQKQPVAARSSFVSWTAPVQDASKYTGNENCLKGECHTSRVIQAGKTVHIKTAVAGMSITASCEACHGPGKEHTDRELEADRTKVKDPEAAKLVFGFNLSPQENSAPCLSCHRTSKEHDFFNRSEHKLQAVGCSECHSAHLVLGPAAAKKDERGMPEAQLTAAPKLPEERRWLNESLLKKAQTELCASCHRSVEAQFAQPHRHRVLDGAMKCTDCHNAHGSPTKPLLQRASTNETCVTCHSDKRGPFVFDHASVKVEGCTYCHTPHGSVNQHLVKRGEVRFLCVSCHRQHGDLSYQWAGPCTRCHVSIHGSNTSEFFVK